MERDEKRCYTQSVVVAELYNKSFQNRLFSLMSMPGGAATLARVKRVLYLGLLLAVTCFDVGSGRKK